MAHAPSEKSFKIWKDAMPHTALVKCKRQPAIIATITGKALAPMLVPIAKSLPVCISSCPEDTISPAMYRLCDDDCKSTVLKAPIRNATTFPSRLARSICTTALILRPKKHLFRMAIDSRNSNELPTTRSPRHADKAFRAWRWQLWIQEHSCKLVKPVQPFHQTFSPPALMATDAAYWNFQSVWVRMYESCIGMTVWYQYRCLRYQEYRKQYLQYSHIQYFDVTNYITYNSICFLIRCYFKTDCTQTVWSFFAFASNTLAMCRALTSGGRGRRKLGSQTPRSPRCDPMASSHSLRDKTRPISATVAITAF